MLRAAPPAAHSCAGSRDRLESSALPGTVGAVTNAAITVATGDGVLDLLLVQPEGKRPMEAGAFARGYAIGPGARFT